MNFFNRIFTFLKINAKKAIFFIIGTVFTIWATLTVDGYFSNEASWKQIDVSVNELMYKIILAENDPTLKAPVHRSAKLEKINFIRQTQIARHFASWNLVKTHLPAVSANSSLDDWRSAINGHESIERHNHENFSALEKKAEYLALYSSLDSQSVIEMPIKTLASIYKAATVDSDECPNCMKVRKDIPVSVPSNLADSGRTVMGIAVASLPNNKMGLPIVDLKSPEILALIKNQKINFTTKQRYFVPAYEVLELIQNSGGSVRAFESDEKTENVPAGN